MNQNDTQRYQWRTGQYRAEIPTATGRHGRQPAALLWLLALAAVAATVWATLQR